MVEVLSNIPDVEIHLVLSDWSKETIRLETDCTLDKITSMADAAYSNHDMAAAISSGSFPVEGMIIVPASMKTVAALRVDSLQI